MTYRAVYDTLYAYKKLEKNDQSMAEGALKHSVASGCDLIGGIIQAAQGEIDADFDPWDDIGKPWRGDDQKYLLDQLSVEERNRALHLIHYVAENLPKGPAGKFGDFQTRLDTVGALTGYLIQQNKESYGKGRGDSGLQDHVVKVTKEKQRERAEKGLLTDYDNYARSYVFAVLNKYGHQDITTYLNTQKATIEYIENLRHPFEDNRLKQLFRSVKPPI